MRFLMAGVMGLTLLAGCGDHNRVGPGLDAKALAQKFIAPAGGKPVGAIVFNENGDIVVVTAKGELAERCRLPPLDRNKDTAGQAADDVPICHRTTDTTLFSITPLAVVRHEGSDCALISSGAHSSYQWQDCW